MKFRERIQRFMYGRNGNDSLNNFFFILYIITIVVYFFISKYVPYNYILFGLQFLLLFIIIFRFLSRNIVKRQIANDRFLNIRMYLKRPFLRFAHRIRDRKTHVYRKCPNCKQVLRLKKIKGEHRVKCPKCSHIFDIKV